MGYYFFYLQLVLCVSYFLFAYRRVDLLTIACFGFVVYLFPLVLPSYFIPEALYLINGMILLLLLIMSILSDSLRSKEASGKDTLLRRQLDNYLFVYTFLKLCLLFSLLLLFLIASQTGLAGLFEYKTDRQQNTYIYSLYVAVVSIGGVLSYAVKSRKIFVYFLGNMILLFLTGTRTHIVMLLLAMLIIYFDGRPVRVFRYFYRPQLVVFMLSIILLGVYGKDIYASLSRVVTEDQSFSETFQERLNYGSGRTSFRNAIYATEPYLTQRIFNRIYLDDYRIESDYLLHLPAQLLPVSGVISDKLHFFSNSVKTRFFATHVNSGISANFWAEGYSLAGVFGVFAFVLLFLCVLYWLNRLVFSAPYFLRPILVLMGVFFAFYIQRNSLFQIISHEKRMFYVTLFLIVLTYTGIYFVQRKPRALA